MSSEVRSAIVIRDVNSAAECHEVERLQKEVWGIPDIEVVPLTQLVAAQASGGILIGAFEAGQMIGFAYGFVGHERGLTVHHSHMVGVDPSYRDRGVGFRLKCEQRKRAVQQGIEVMTWTFDPLRSLNARFNFGKLGVVARLYFADLYGDYAESFLHQNGTDRLWVTWLLKSERVERRIAGETPMVPAGLPSMIAVGDTGEPLLRDPKAALRSAAFTMEIPRDIGALEAEQPELARNWRVATREAFTSALSAGFVVEEFVFDPERPHGNGKYVLRRPSE